MKTSLLSPVIIAAALSFGAATPARSAETARVSSQERETVRQTEQEMTAVQQQARWQQLVQEHDRNGDGQLDQGEKLMALERVRLMNEEQIRQASGESKSAQKAAAEAQNQVRDQNRVTQEAREQERLQDRTQTQEKSRTQAMLNRFDANKDGKLSDAEFNQGLGTMQRETVARMEKIKATEKTMAKDQSQDTVRDQDRLRDLDKDRLQDRDLLRDQQRSQLSRPAGQQSQRRGGGRH